MNEEAIGHIVIDAAIRIHRELGPGLLESVYEAVLEYELQQHKLKVVRQLAVPIQYRGVILDGAFRADMIVDGKVILELKSVEGVTRAHRKQLQTYLSLTGLKLGFLLNFGEALMKDGIVRAVNGLENSKY